MKISIHDRRTTRHSHIHDRRTTSHDPRVTSSGLTRRSCKSCTFVDSIHTTRVHLNKLLAIGMPISWRLLSAPIPCSGPRRPKSRLNETDRRQSLCGQLSAELAERQRQALQRRLFLEYPRHHRELFQDANAMMQQWPRARSCGWVRG
jgi:hypothetical protein